MQVDQDSIEVTQPPADDAAVRPGLRSRVGGRLAGWGWLVAAALVLELVYAGFFLRRFPLVPNYILPLQDLGKLGGYHPLAGLAMGLALALTAGAHALAWWHARRLTTAAIGPVLAISLLFQVTLALVYPIMAADVFTYLLQGRLLVVHGLNPLTATPAQAIGDPWLPYSAYRDIQLAYGPLWVWLAVLIVTLSRDSLLLGLLGVKALAIVANLANAGLIYRIAERLRPGAGLPALVCYAWSPLVLFETVANAHNDSVLATPLLLAVWLVVRGGPAAALAPVAMMAATLVKYAPGLLLPLVTLATWQTRRRPGAPVWAGLGTVLIGLVLCGLLLLAGLAPFWEGPATLAGLDRQSREITTSLAALLIYHGADLWPRATWLAILRPASWVLLLAIMLWRRPTTSAGLPGAAYDLLLAQLLLATFWFQPWYLVPLVALAAASADRWRQGLGLLFAASASASYLVYFYLWATRWWGLLSIPQVQTLAAAVVYLPPLVALAVYAWRRRSSPLLQRNRSPERPHTPGPARRSEPSG